ncbi:MAG: hypothetical protein R3E04_10205 [Sphingobium sp.]
MGTLTRMSLLAGASGVLYSLFRKKWQRNAMSGEPVFSSGVVRNAGPDEQKGVHKRSWDKVDEQSDESFPASDPPATY